MEVVYSAGSSRGVGLEVFQRLNLKNGIKIPCRVFCSETDWKEVEKGIGSSSQNTNLHIETQLNSASLQEFYKKHSLNAPSQPHAFGYFLQAVRYVAEKPNERVLVTGPMRKEDFPQKKDSLKIWGHTEVLCAYFEVPRTVMLFVSSEVKLIPLTLHIPLKEVSKFCTSENLFQVFSILENSSPAFGISAKKLKIGLCGVNPHGGEGGLIGQEEVDWLIPAMKTLRNSGWDVTGPLSADSAMIPTQNSYDLIVSMYHDQLLPAFKSLYFHNSAQCTLGIPIVRTSVDHGTADDLFLTGLAQTGGLESALFLAIEILGRKKEHEATFKNSLSSL